MKTFAENKQMASDALCDMEYELALLCRAHRNYIRHGAVNAAAELTENIDALENGIACETESFRMAFY